MCDGYRFVAVHSQFFGIDSNGRRSFKPHLQEAESDFGVNYCAVHDGTNSFVHQDNSNLENRLSSALAAAGVSSLTLTLTLTQWSGRDGGIATRLFTVNSYPNLQF